MAKEKLNANEENLTPLERLVKNAEKSFDCYTGIGSDPRSIITKAPSGIEFLDAVIAGGFKRGGIHLLSGGFASGKTLIAQKTMASMQKENPDAIIVYIDAEHRFDPEWFRLTGVNLDKVVVQRPNYGEQAMDMVIFWCKNNADLVVVDSLAALTPLAEEEDGMEKKSMGLQARLLSQAFRKITPINNKTVLLCINQLRVDIGNPYNRGVLHKMPGGDSQYYYAGLIIEVRRGEWITDKLGKKIGHQINCLVTKCNYAPPFGSCKIPLIYKTGEIDVIGAIVNVAIDEKLIGKKGGWYYIAECVDALQGVDAVTTYYKEHPVEFEALKQKVFSIPTVSDPSAEAQE
jgi:recombination protein RecA